ncbi:cytochrome P450 [Jatrophihabitans sp.]|uniref:cytochrome P450 n=1 Tax=Jatrophihabitans sp. TaxID=1932789 RepID=UPI0030C6A906|nr:cytochrome [Jatrophihabitans sp.]
MTRPAHVPEDLVVDFDTLGDLKIDEMHARARGWRADKGSVVWTDHNGGYWVVLGAAEFRRGLIETETFNSASRGIKLVDIEDREVLVPIELDGPEHTQYRRVLNPFFAPRRMRVLEEQVRKVARDLLAGIAPKGRCDVVTEYARPLASSMFLSLVDWPLEDREILERLVSLQVNGMPGKSPEENQRIQTDALHELAAYCERQITSRRENPRDDLTTQLINATVDGEPIPDSRLVAGIMPTLVAGGLDTTQSVTSQTIRLFAEDPSRQDYLREDGTRLHGVVEEILRYAAPVGPLRAAIQDTELAGVSIKSGDRLHFMSQLANRDPAEFDDPAELHLDRESNRHLSFGLGPHRCIGAALGRVVLAVAIEEFHLAIPTYHLVHSDSQLGAVWSMRSVIVEWDPDRSPSLTQTA